MNEITEMLQRGIAAAKAGDQEMARAWLMRVVERDERNAKAWLWLSGVMNTAEDKEVCLENVLALDPDNAAARRGLEALRKKTGAASRPSAAAPSLQYTGDRSAPPTLAAAILRGAPAEPEPQAPGAEGYTPPSLEEAYASGAAPAPSIAAALFRAAPTEAAQKQAELEAFTPSVYVAPAMGPSSGPATSIEAEQAWLERLGEFDDEYLCPYCAEPTQPDDKTCAVCQKPLWEQFRRQKERSIWLWLVITIQLAAAGLSTLGFLVIGMLTVQPLFSAGELSVAQFVNLYLGLLPPEELPVSAQLLGVLPPLAFWSFVVSVSIQLGIAALLYMRWPPIFWIGAVVLGANGIFALVSALTRPQGASMISVIFAFAPLFLWAMLKGDFTVDHKRILSRADKDIKTHSSFYMRGREYARKKMWTLAAIHFKRAVGGSPGILAYYLGLATAYTKLKRYKSARLALQEAQRIDPDNPAVRELAELVADDRAMHVT